MNRRQLLRNASLTISSLSLFAAPVVNGGENSETEAMDHRTGDDQSIKNQLIGAWRLTAADWQHVDGRVRELHHTPVGRLMYDANGYMTAQTMPAKRANYVSANPMESTPEELGVGCDKVVSYFGTYDVDEEAKIVRHTLEMAALPNWIGSVQIRHVEMDGGRMALSAPLPTDGKEGRVILRWQKLNEMRIS